MNANGTVTGRVMAYYYLEELVVTVTDCLDGTLLNSNHRLWMEMKTFLRFLSLDCCLTMIVATGRAIRTVCEIFLDFD
jgi:hydroxymethylpyrimidine pyrophosphatase-like HAD family hydrolase